MTLFPDWQRVCRPKLLVIGDVILDRYTWGDAARISPEAPVPVLLAETEEVRLGGAASGAAFLRGLEAQVSLLGVVGDDASGRIVQRLATDEQIDLCHLATDPQRRGGTVENRPLNWVPLALPVL